jgi:hypothetical protein
VLTGMSVTAISAAVSSFSGLRSLAIATGWPSSLALLLPGTIDAYAMTATRIWLTGPTSRAARRFARWNAIMAICLSLIGNGLWHLLAAHVLSVSWPMVVTVGAVPPAVLGLLTHLAVLRTASAGNSQDGRQDGRPAADDDQDNSEPPILAVARSADDAYRREHGTAITRDALRRELRVSTEKASAVLKLLRETHQQEKGSNS